MEYKEFRLGPREQKRRMEILRWMQRMGWSWEIIDAIMYRDNPTPEHVRKTVYVHGPILGYQLIHYMNSDSEQDYDEDVYQCGRIQSP